MRQWRRLLSLFVFGGARLRSYRAHRHLRARLSANGGSTAVRRDAAAEEDPAHRNHRTLRVLEWTTASSTPWGRPLLARFRVRRAVIRSRLASSRSPLKQAKSSMSSHSCATIPVAALSASSTL